MERPHPCRYAPYKKRYYCQVGVDQSVREHIGPYRQTLDIYLTGQRSLSGTVSVGSLTADCHRGSLPCHYSLAETTLNKEATITRR